MLLRPPWRVWSKTRRPLVSTTKRGTSATASWRPSGCSATSRKAQRSMAMSGRCRCLPFTYGPNDRAVGGACDAIYDLEHEISEDMVLRRKLRRRQLRRRWTCFALLHLDQIRLLPPARQLTSRLMVKPTSLAEFKKTTPVLHGAVTQVTGASQPGDINPVSDDS